jgi:sialidase-1
VILALLLAVQSADVFVAGRDGYHTFRIPAVVSTSKGTLLAFAEGRKAGRGDAGDIDLVLRRSSDGGATWGSLQVVWDDGANTCGNPCPVVDGESVWLLLTHNLGEDKESAIIDRTAKGTRTAWITRSLDDGATWSPPRELTTAVKKPDWTWYATGPGAGIRMRSGRLVVPIDFVDAEAKRGGSGVIFSDDRGETWTPGGTLHPGVNECQVAELAGGFLHLNMRNYKTAERARAISISTDGGLTWGAIARDESLPEPQCQASLLRHSWKPSRLLFSNPADAKSRVRMTVKSSADEGGTWSVVKVLHEGPSAYSCLVGLADGAAGCLFELGEKHPYEKIAFVRFNP